MKKFFRQLKDSFTNFLFYREIAGQKSAKTFKYFILLFTLVFLIEGIKFAIVFNSGLTAVIAAVKEQVPEFTLSGGELKVEGPQPIVIGGEGETVMVIDTTGQVDRSVLDQYTEGVFVSKDGIVNKQAGRTNEIRFADIPQLELNKDKVVDYLPMLRWLLIIFGVFGYVAVMAWVLVTTVILALIGLLINYLRKGTLNFANTWNIAVYALTLPWLLEMAVFLIYPQLPYFWFVKWGIAGFILYKGIEATGQPPVPEGAAPPKV